jgi:hypothetical protein
MKIFCVHRWIRTLLSIHYRKVFSRIKITVRQNQRRIEQTNGRERKTNVDSFASSRVCATSSQPLVAPNDANKQAVQGMIEKLKAGKDIN